MTDSFVSEHVDEILYELSWKTPSGIADQWAVLFRLLPALSAQSWALGTVSGTLRIGRGSLDAPTFEEWSIRGEADVVALRARIDSLGELPWPIELRLDCEPLVWLPDDHINVIDYDDVDLFSFGPGRVAMSKLNGGPFSVPGLQSWRLHHSPVPLLLLEVMFGTPGFATSMGLEVCSKCDLWRSTRLDGEPNGRHGEANANLLARSLGEVAMVTGARLSPQPPTAAERG